MERRHKNKILLDYLNHINLGAKTGIFSDYKHYCPNCRCYRFDPQLNSFEAGAYLNFASDTLGQWRTTKQYALPYVKYDNAVRYHLSALNEFADRRIKP